ncbi:MAG TPA: RagB/SusD family nutrient uptake outer membrane protein, partial [Sphingobacteriaceae bacterium]
YTQIFKNQSQDVFDNEFKETIWELDFYGNSTGGLDLGGRWVNYGTVRMVDNQPPDVLGGYAYGYMGATPYLYKSYEAGDIRRDWTIAEFAYVGSNSLLKTYKPITDFDRVMGKWRREYEPFPRAIEYSATNFPMLRYADVLLMFAEAENMIGGTPSVPSARAYDALNQVRRRAFGRPANTPATAPISVVSALTLSTSGNTGYNRTVNEIPVTFTGGGGTGASGVASVSSTTGKVTGLHVTNAGSGYTSAPTVSIGTQWQANTPYSAGQQVFHLTRLYTVQSSGTSSAVAPTNTTGTSSPASTGVGFTYAGLRATATSAITTSVIDVSGLSATAFQEAIREERARELAFEGLRKQDLIRWGIFIPRMKEVLVDPNWPTTTTFNRWKEAFENVSEKHKVYPIPLDELNVNTAIEQHELWK